MIAAKSGTVHERNGPIGAPDKRRVLAELPAAMDQFCELVLTVNDLDVDGVGHWSASDVAAHVVSMLEIYVGLARGGGSPAATTAAVHDVSQSALERVQDRRPPALVDRLQGAVQALTDVARSREGDPVVPWHTGWPVPISALLGLMVGEAAVHGYDIARANRRRWRIPSAWAETVLRAMLPLTPLYLDSSKSAKLGARIDVRLRGTDFRARFNFAGGQLRISEPSRNRADCYISGGPTGLLLVLYRRTSPLRLALTGDVVAWGRKPWLAFRLPNLFHTL